MTDDAMTDVETTCRHLADTLALMSEVAPHLADEGSDRASAKALAEYERLFDEFRAMNGGDTPEVADAIRWMVPASGSKPATWVQLYGRLLWMQFEVFHLI